MHDTALEIGRMAIEIYAGEKPRILEVGSMDVNGSLRKFAPEGSGYLGVDLEPGNGVDHVVTAGEALPFADGSFDLILASSVFEHDPAFWNTFLDLVRLLRKGGHLYISAPSNGAFHRFPEDHWRFYPDSGRALERWATSQGQSVRLIESFTAPRKADIWNDFIAVFQRGKKKAALPSRLLHAQFNGQNVWTLGADDLLKVSPSTQDMQLLRSTIEQVAELEGKSAKQREEIDKIREEAASQKNQLDARLIKQNQDIAKRDAELDVAAKQAHTLQSTLRQREEEIAQVSRERETLESKAREELESANKTALQERNELTKRLGELQKQAEELSAERDLSLESLAKASRELEEANGKIAKTHDELEESQAQIVQKKTELLKTKRKLSQARKAADEARANAANLNAQSEKDARSRREMKVQVSELKSSLEKSKTLVEQSNARLRDAQRSLETRFDEIAELSKFLSASETRVELSREREKKEAETREWMARVHAHLADVPFWLALLPPQIRTKQRIKHIQRTGLFDGDKYLELYPDVRAAGMDPLRHYMLHGIVEGRNKPV